MTEKSIGGLITAYFAQDMRMNVKLLQDEVLIMQVMSLSYRQVNFGPPITKVDYCVLTKPLFRGIEISEENCFHFAMWQN